MTRVPSEPPLPMRPVPPPEAVTQAILERCCKELTPRHGRSIRARLTISVALSAALVLALLGVAWTSHLRQHSMAGVTAIALGWGLLQLSVLVMGLALPPGKRPSRRWRWSTIAAALCLALLQPVILLVGGACEPPQPELPGALGVLRCGVLSLSCGAVVTGTMIWIWRRTDPFSPRLSGTMLGLSGGLAGAVGVGFSCPDHGMTHLWLGHISAVVVLTVLGRLAGKRCLSP